MLILKKCFKVENYLKQMFLFYNIRQKKKLKMVGQKLYNKYTLIKIVTLTCAKSSQVLLSS